MNKYLYLFRGADEHMSELSNEEQQAHMQRWGVWMKRWVRPAILWTACL